MASISVLKFGSSVLTHPDRLSAVVHDIYGEYRQCRHVVVIVPGSIGVSSDGQCALMGRGGSDLTAVFPADKLDTPRCRLVKDVAGLYEQELVKYDRQQSRPLRFSHITYADALRTSEENVQPKAIKYLEQRHRRATVSGLQHRSATVVGATESITTDNGSERPLHVLLLGLGAVGRGVYEHCLARAAPFELVGIGVRSRLDHPANEAPLSIVNDDLEELLNRPYEVLVELTGNTELASTTIRRSLHSGRSVVTANKSLLAVEGSALLQLATAHNAALRYSAAVGGAAPMLEMVRKANRIGGVRRLRGILSGTCNYVFDRMAARASISVAISQAQRLGLANVNPERDLSGEDSEDQLRLLATEAFSLASRALRIRRQGLDAIDDASLSTGAKPAHLMRMVASVTSDGIGHVRPEALRATDPLFCTRQAENRLLIEFDKRNGVRPLADRRIGNGRSV